MVRHVFTHHVAPIKSEVLEETDQTQKQKQKSSYICVSFNVFSVLFVFSLVSCLLFSSLQPLTNETNLRPEEMRDSALYKEPIDPAKWFGIRKDATVLGYSQVWSLDLAVIAGDRGCDSSLAQDP